jgi:hypothetical protein
MATSQSEGFLSTSTVRLTFHFLISTWDMKSCTTIFNLTLAKSVDIYSIDTNGFWDLLFGMNKRNLYVTFIQDVHAILNLELSW